MNMPDMNEIERLREENEKLRSCLLGDENKVAAARNRAADLAVQLATARGALEKIAAEKLTTQGIMAQKALAEIDKETNQ